MDSCVRVAILVGFGFPFKSMPRVAKFLSVEKDRVMRRPEGDVIIIEEAINICMGTPIVAEQPVAKPRRGRPPKTIVELIS